MVHGAVPLTAVPRSFSVENSGQIAQIWAFVPLPCCLGDPSPPGCKWCEKRTFSFSRFCFPPFVRFPQSVCAQDTMECLLPTAYSLQHASPTFPIINSVHLRGAQREFPRLCSLLSSPFFLPVYKGAAPPPPLLMGLFSYLPMNYFLIVF